MGKLLPIMLALVGLGAGVGAGLVLKPDPPVVEDAAAKDGAEAGHADAAGKAKEDTHAGDPTGDHSAKDPGDVEYVKMNNQFVVPVVQGAKVTALVVLSLSLEVSFGQRENVYQLEPKLRDGFLQVLFDHANSGGFNGNFTDTAPMNTLRNALHEVAVKVVGPEALDVLIVDIVRQDSST